MKCAIKVTTTSPSVKGTPEQAVDWIRDPLLYPPHLRSRIRRGCGFGEGAVYKPWVTIRGFGSKGTCAGPTGIRICREFQLLSSLEETYFFLLERDANVIDIREQFPILDLSSTLRLCAERGVAHVRRKGQIDPFHARLPDSTEVAERDVATREEHQDGCGRG